jgi:uncharacterized membrane protein YkvA (DUF1232 family)
MIRRIREWAGRLRREVRTLALALRHPDTPWYAKAFAALIVAYVVSPVDPIPDFIPVIGHLDELLLVPPLIALAIRMIPPEVISECRRRVRNAPPESRLARLGTFLVILSWFLLAGVVGWLTWRRLRR